MVWRAWAVHHGAVAVVTFDWNKAGMAWDESDWRLANDPRAANIIREEFEKPHFVKQKLSPEESLNLILSQPQMALVA